MDPCEIANVLAKEILFYQLSNLEGLNSGVPTRTTSTLTPTTLRNIEQTFIDLQCRADRHHNQAGFVPPPIAQSNFGVIHAGPSSLSELPSSINVAGGGGSSGSSATYGTDSSGAGSPAAARSIATPPPPQAKRRNMGGRRPAKAPQNLSPEEEERRKVRRERNKMAAARCRKRRLDHTNELIEETAGLERKKQSLQSEIRQLQNDREELEMVLRAHSVRCRLQNGHRPDSPPDIKPVFNVLTDEEKGPPSGPSALYNITDSDDGVRVKVEVMESVENIMSFDNDIIFTSPQANKRIMLSSANLQVVTTTSDDLNTPTPTSKPSRPSFLNVPLSITPAQAHGLKANPGSSVEVAGVAITTPSNGIPFNFDSLMEGGTGLTPVQPYATQQHKMQPEILAPDQVLASKLVML